jgi:predicted small metal-binding protein
MIIDDDNNNNYKSQHTIELSLLPQFLIKGHCPMISLIRYMLPLTYHMKSLTCREAGFDCAAVIKGDTEDEIMQKAGEHARSEHNIKPEDMTPEFQQKIRGLIHTA